MLKVSSLAIILLGFLPASCADNIRESKPGMLAKIKGKIASSIDKDSSVTNILFPGVTPEEYEPFEEIEMSVDLVESKKTHVPFAYDLLPVCPSLEQEKKVHRNIGAKLQGVSYKPSPYPLKVLENSSCKPLCMIKISKRKLSWLRRLIARQYRVHMTLDSLPVLMKSYEYKYATRGFPVGFKTGGVGEEEEYFLYNHLRFRIGYNQVVTDAISSRNIEPVHITSFEVHPVSIKHVVDGDTITSDTQIDTCSVQKVENVVNDPSKYLSLDAGTDENLDVVYSYEVEWVDDQMIWSDRWDVYLIGSPDDEIHYFAIVNSLLVVVFLSCIVCVIMVRTLKKDIATYNDISLDDDDIEETGWKLIHGDVFRPPQKYALLLSVCVGTGSQIAVSIIITLTAGLFGILNPMNKGDTLSTIILLYALSGSVAGYVSSRIYKFCDGKAWKRATILTAAGFPGFLVGMFILLNLFLAFAGAATAVTIWTILILFLMWVCVATPLVCAGSYFGYESQKIESPTKTNQIARFIPEGPWYTKTPYSWVISSLLPFSSVSIEILFIMAAVWLHQIYYAIGFLLFVVLILALTCAEVAIVMNYLQLAAEDYQWWWSSFMNCAFTGFYLILYSIWFLSSKLSLVGVLPVVVYFTYMSMMAVTLSLFCGAMGFLACLLFNKVIYAAVKVD